jgi:hypothetical protein
MLVWFVGCKICGRLQNYSSGNYFFTQTSCGIVESYKKAAFYKEGGNFEKG